MGVFGRALRFVALFVAFGIASWLAIYPEERLVVALLANVTGAPLEGTMRRVAQAFLTPPAPAQPPQPPQASAQPPSTGSREVETAGDDAAPAERDADKE